MTSPAKHSIANDIVIDILFHSLFEDPPIDCPSNRTIVDLLLDGHVNAISTTVTADTYGTVDFKNFCAEVYRYYLLEDTLPEKVKIIYESKDLLKAKKEGKLGVILSTQGADIIEQDIRLITIAQKLGLRVMQITYNQNSYMGSGVFEPNDQGLTRFGQQSINEMNRLGVVIDLSHVGYKTSLDAIEFSQDPVIFSHSSVKAICGNPRNIDDLQIKQVAAKDGIIGLCPHSVMCTPDIKSYPDVNVFIDHMVYISDLVGPEYIAIGTDRFALPTLEQYMRRIEFERTLPGFFGPYDVSQKHVAGFNRFDDWENLRDTMAKRGFEEEEISKILGGNLLRLFERVWDKNSAPA